MLEGDPYTYEDDNEEDEGYEHAYATDSDDDRSVPKFSEKETDAFVKVWGRDPNVHEFKDVRQAHLAVADSNLREYGPERPRPLTEDEAQSRPRARPLIYPGLKFKAMLDMQVWFQEYAVSHHRPYIVFKSDQNERYVLICENEDCPWKVWARKKKPEGWWKISKYEGPHTCGNAVLEGNKHRQLTSTFIAHRCANAIKATPTLQAASLVQFVKLIFDYHIKYGKAWRAKQMAMKMVYGDWEEAYGRLPRLLAAMAHRNPGMTHIVQPHPIETRTVEGVKYQVFRRAFWCFRPCVEAFKHCRPFLCVDGTFLTGKFRGTLLVAISCDADNRLVPLAFALVEKEDNVSWNWFMHLVRTTIVGPGREVCVISDRNPAILNAMRAEIPEHPLVKHRWCIRHFAGNFYRACRNREMTEYLRRLTLVFEPAVFEEMFNELYGLTNEKGKGFLRENLPKKHLWAQAFDQDGVRYGHMTSNMAEIFNKVLKGIRTLPVTAIASFTFDKCNEYWVTRSDEVKVLINADKRWPKTVEEELGYQATKSHDQTWTCFDKEVWKYEVSEVGGTNSGGEQYGGRKYVVVLAQYSCTCQMPLQIHLPCSHIITACRARAVDPYNSVSRFYNLEELYRTWAGRFEPYLDMAQWPKYTGPVYLPDSKLMIDTKGRRATKRFKMDMDQADGGTTFKRPRPNDDFVEDSVKNRCSVCGEEGHKNTKKLSCEDRKKKLAAEKAAAEAAAAVAASNPSSSGRGRGPKRPRGTRHMKGYRRRPKVIGKLAEALQRARKVIFCPMHVYFCF